jgi:ATP-dependent helicase HrpB
MRCHGKALSVERLPVDAFLPDITAQLRQAGGLVITAEPGAGKTTRVPAAILDAGLAGAGSVVVLQPRRVAARAAARRVAQERHSAAGAEVGWQVRFENRSSASTRLLYITEGILTRRLLDDPALDGVGCVVLDEFHERSLHADLALALLKEVRASLRPDLRIVVMSATLLAEPVAAFLGAAPIVRVPGRLHPVEIQHAAERDERPMPQRAALAVRRALADAEGDILVFLPGAGEIRRVQEALRDVDAADILPLHGELRPEDQDRALQQSERRKVILATNIAETSLTIPGVRTVIDSGLARVLVHDADHGLDRLELRPISRASATQRAGRAGRVAAGRVVRLWTRGEEAAMPEFETPEVQRVDLARTALELHAFGERDLNAFAWFEAPPPEMLARATQYLERCGATTDGRLSPLGERMLRIPTNPRLARLLLAAEASGVGPEGALVAALLSERDIVRGQDAAALEHEATGTSDVLLRLDLLRRGGSLLDRAAVDAVLKAAEHFAAAAGLRAATARRSLDDATESSLLRALLLAFPDRLARRKDKGRAEGVMVGGRGVQLSPRSVVRDAELFLVLDADLGRRGENARIQVRTASAVESAWLNDLPGALKEERVTAFDSERGRVMQRRTLRFEDLLLEESASPVADKDAERTALREILRAEPERFLAGRSADELDLLVRMNCLSVWCPELELPALDGPALVAAADPWLDSCRSLKDVEGIALSEVLASALGATRYRRCLEMAPESLSLPSGSTRRLQYELGKLPLLAVRLQELFGEPDTPTIANGRVKVLLHLLAPNHQVVQVTQDLKSFWNNTYPQVRRDLRGRYPRHSWPEDPWTAEPTARAKRRGPR